MIKQYPFRHFIRRGLPALIFACLLWRGDLSAAPVPPANIGASVEHRFAALRMGTQFRVVLFAIDALKAQKAALAAFDRVEELEDIMSDYREQSELMRLCRRGVGTPQPVTPELFFVLEKALRMSVLSGGAFDVTLGPVTLLWREARREKRLPDPAALKKARQLVGYTNVVLDGDARTVALKIPGLRIDLGGIGKGYAADEALAVLKAQGFTMALVQAGGEVVAGAAPPGKQGWRIAVRKLDPADSEAPGDLILHDCGVSTSGDEFQFLEINGRRYSHIISPADGMGLKDSPEVTVVARDGITADALATALDILPVREALKLVESIDGASSVITSRGPDGFRHFYSRGFPKIPSGTANKTETPRSQRNPRHEH